MSSPALSSPGEDGEHGDMQNFVPTALMNTTQASNKFQLKIAAVNKKRIREICKAVGMLFVSVIINSTIALALKHHMEAEPNRFSAYYLLTWICSSTFALPLLVIVMGHRYAYSRNRAIQDAVAIVPATIVIQLTIYAALRGIPYIEISEMMALLIAHRSFVLFAGWIIFHWPVSPIRARTGSNNPSGPIGAILPLFTLNILISGTIVVSAAISMMGVVMITHGKGLYSSAFRGVCCGTVASALLAIGELICCYTLGRTTQKQWTIMIGFYGMCSLICTWPLLLVFGFTGIEHFVDVLEFWYICPVFCFAVLGNVSLHIWGNLITFPCIPKLSLLLSCAVTAIVDQLWFDIGLPVLQLLGFIFLLFGYTLLLFRDKIAEELAEEFDIDDITTV